MRMLRSRFAIIILGAWFLAIFAGPVAACVPVGETMPGVGGGGSACCCGGADAMQSHQAATAAIADADSCACAMTPSVPAPDAGAHPIALPVLVAAVRPVPAVLRVPTVRVAATAPRTSFTVTPPRLLPLASDAGRAPPFA